MRTFRSAQSFALKKAPRYNIHKKNCGRKEENAMKKTGMAGGYNIRTKTGMKAMLEAVAEGFPGYSGEPFRLSMVRERERHLGEYWIDEREIHFSGVPDTSDLMLIEIGLHEMAHHIDTCLNGKCTRHSRGFYKILFGLYFRAQELGVVDYEDVTNYDTTYLADERKIGRPHDIQMMEKYFGRPDGHPVNEELLAKELKSRKEARPTKADKKAMEEMRKREELEAAKRKREYEEMEREVAWMEHIFFGKPKPEGEMPKLF